MPGRVRWVCVRPGCRFIDLLADPDPVCDLPIVCWKCQLDALEERRSGLERRQINRYGPWKIRGERRTGRDRRR